MTLKPRTQLFLLLLVFFGPLLLAAIAYYGPWEWAPRASHGELIEPPVALPRSALGPEAGEAQERAQNRWSFIYARLAPCEQECLDHLLRLHQVRLALAEERDRVRMVLLFAGPKPPLPPEAGWVMTRLDDPAGKATLEILGAENVHDGRVYIADPLGNLVMSYPPDAAQKGMLEDLERLLTVSRIG